MSNPAEASLLAPLLDSWERSNTILLNLLHAFTPQDLDVGALPGSMSTRELFAHIHETRLFFVVQTAPEYAHSTASLLQSDGPRAERDPGRIADALKASATAVRDAVQQRIETNQALWGEHVSYDHPLLLVQHLLWHEGYHVGQMMLALKAAGRPMRAERSAPLVWDVWRHESWDAS